MELRNFTAGVYVCANGGNCSAPDTCRCAAGWAGFDCRTPICDQGYYVPLQERFVAGTLLKNEVCSINLYLPLSYLCPKHALLEKLCSSHCLALAFLS